MRRISAQEKIESEMSILSSDCCLSKSLTMKCLSTSESFLLRVAFFENTVNSFILEIYWVLRFEDSNLILLIKSSHHQISEIKAELSSDDPHNSLTAHQSQPPSLTESQNNPNQTTKNGENSQPHQIPHSSHISPLCPPHYQQPYSPLSPTKTL